MTPEQQERVKELFEAASDLDPSQQETFLDEACEDEEVLAEVKSLLSQHIPKGFMGGPVLSGKSSSSGKKSGPSALSEAALKKIGVRYEGIVEVGGGGMGTVYRARDRETKEVVALKILRPEIAGDEQQVERFKNEVLLAHQITHKNVCRIYDFSRADGTAYISMEFVEGDTLRHIVDRFGSLSVRSAIQITQQICTGLQEAHARGVVHRDLKPDNVMIDRNGQVKVMDFGIARSVHASSGTTGLIVGTPAYMAPEQAEGSAVDARTDIYSLGLIIYELLTGTAAFGGDTPMEIAFKQVHEHPKPPHELDHNIPEDVERVVLKCLEKDPSERFQSAQELEGALSRLQEAVVASPRLRPERTNERKHERRPRLRPRWLAASCLFVAGLVVGLVLGRVSGIWHGPTPPWHEEMVNSVAFSSDGKLLATASEDKTVKLWHAGTWRRVRTLSRHTRPVEVAVFSPDGQWLASGGIDKTVRVWEVTSGRELQCFRGSRQVNVVSFNADGSRLASGEAGGRVTVWDPRTGKEMLHFAADSGSINGLAFSPDGYLLASGGAGEVINVWDAATGRFRLRIAGHSDELSAVVFSPNGLWIASGSYDKTVRLWDLSSGQELRTLSQHKAAVRDVAFSPNGSRLASASDDATVRVWDSSTGDQVRVLSLDEGSTSVAFSPDGKWLASGRGDGVVNIWEVQTWKQIK